jgi:ABC-type branched-subunit amino acid transport system substrate-binding protein
VDVAARDIPFDKLIASKFAAAAAEVGVEIGREGADAALTIGQTDGLSLLPGGRRADGPGDEVHAIALPLAPENLPGAEFPAQFEEAFDRPPGPYAAYGFEAMSLALQGIAAAADSDDEFRAAVIGGVLDSERPDSILGAYSITEDGDTTLCAVQPYAFDGRRSVPGEPICPRD